ncbi:hypothetical protein [Elongatibacter sediminis]|uniref:Adenylyl cyclase n=1 Tax=Elongatibacter sediminis TaxID=3119006 RepID=A0AAW9RJW7_9GAMM
MSFFRELIRRNVLRVGLAYALVAWLALQGMDFALQIVAGPPRLLDVLRFVAVAGLPLALILSWLFAFTSEGVRREPPFGQSSAAPPRAHRRLDRLIMAALAAVVAILLADRVMPERASGEGIGETPDPKAQEALDSAAAPGPDRVTENLSASSAEPEPEQQETQHTDLDRRDTQQPNPAPPNPEPES